jgi:hypothetical protein
VQGVQVRTGVHNAGTSSWGHSAHCRWSWMPL